MQCIFEDWGESGESQHPTEVQSRFPLMPDKWGCVFLRSILTSFWQPVKLLIFSLFLFFFFSLRRTENQSAFSSAVQAVKGLYSQLGSVLHVWCPASVSWVDVLTSENLWKLSMTLTDLLPHSNNNLLTSHLTTTIWFAVQKPSNFPEPHTMLSPITDFMIILTKTGSVQM